MSTQNNDYGIYDFPLYKLKHIDNLREIIENAEKYYADRNAFLIKDPIALRELDPRSEEARNYKIDSDDPYRPVKYKQFAADVRALGSYLKSIGISRKNKVAILAETRYEWYVSYMAVINGLAILVPLDKELQDPELLNNLERSQVNTIIYSKNNRDSLVHLKDKIPFIENYISMDLPEAEANGKSVEDNEINGKTEHFFWDVLEEGYEVRANGDTSYDTLPLDPDDFWLLLFTSGTSSKSKAVMLSHTNIVTVVDYASSMVDFENATLLSILPLHHTYESTCGFVIQMFMGNTVAVSDGLLNVVKNVRQSGTTMILMVPAILEAFYRILKRKISQDKELEAKFKKGLEISKTFEGDNPETLKKRRELFKPIHQATGGTLLHLVVGGAYIKPEVLEFFNLLGFIAFQGYGLTEASPILALNRDYYKRDGAAGLPIPTMEAKIINQDDKGIGEICGRGPSIMLGYYEDPELTKEAIDEDGFYHTGDYGYMDDNQFIYITGRKANIIVAKNGENIFPEEIETVLDEADIIQEVVVYAHKDERTSDQIIVAEVLPDEKYVEAKYGEDTPLDAPEVLEDVKAAVKEKNKELRQIQRVEKVVLRTEPFPRNTSNKIVRRKIQKNI